MFIGCHMDIAALVGRLESCLLTTAEMELGEKQWKRFPDPFPNWVEKESSENGISKETGGVSREIQVH